MFRWPKKLYFTMNSQKVENHHGQRLMHLQCVSDSVLQKQSVVINRRGVLFLHDNGWPHTANTTKHVIKNSRLRSFASSTLLAGHRPIGSLHVFGHRPAGTAITKPHDITKAITQCLDSKKGIFTKRTFVSLYRVGNM